MLAHRWSIGLRVIAIVELIKGAAVLFAFAMVAAGNWTMQSLMGRVVHYLRFREEGRIAHFFKGTIAHLEPVVLVWLALAYVTLRFTEAYGLWKERHWGEWLAVLSAAVYVPAEIYELCMHYSHRKVGVLAVNILIIVFLCWVLWKTRSVRNRRRSL